MTQSILKGAFVGLSLSCVQWVKCYNGKVYVGNSDILLSSSHRKKKKKKECSMTYTPCG